MRAYLAIALVLVAGVAWAQESAPIAEMDALKLEKAELEVRALMAEISARQERIERIKVEATLFAQAIRQRDGRLGCDIDLEKRLWVCKSTRPGTGNGGPIQEKR